MWHERGLSFFRARKMSIYRGSTARPSIALFQMRCYSRNRCNLSQHHCLSYRYNSISIDHELFYELCIAFASSGAANAVDGECSVQQQHVVFDCRNDNAPTIAYTIYKPISQHRRNVSLTNCTQTTCAMMKVLEHTEPAIPLAFLCVIPHQNWFATIADPFAMNFTRIRDNRNTLSTTSPFTVIQLPFKAAHPAVQDDFAKVKVVAF